ncbi:MULTISPECIES: imidazolonepropionase-like domain-containing protein [Streptomyces]|uniref:Aminodeoxyfutalosine deaminase/Imidazolonepropionase-like composite domain-containing protein n=1 Tax=Streptomyces sp. NBC_00093 TaxID=2975649 RepID=A0AAU2A0U2_9ACTN
MLTIHTADEVRLNWAAEYLKNAAVAVDGNRVTAVGPLTELTERFPGARVRQWPGGVLGPALVHEGPLPTAPTPRERVHAVLKAGAVAVLEEYVTSPDLRSAAARNELVVLRHTRTPEIVEGERADLAVFDGGGVCIATVCTGRLVHRRR